MNDLKLLSAIKLSAKKLKISPNDDKLVVLCKNGILLFVELNTLKVDYEMKLSSVS